MIPTIFICGKKNIGKTSLIRSCFDSASYGPTQSVHGVDLFESPVVNFAEAQTPDLLQAPQKQYAQAVWYCIDGTSPAFEILPETFDCIKSMGKRVLIVVTKCELLNGKQLRFVNETLLKHFLREQIVLVSAREKTGLPLLIRKTEIAIRNTAGTIGKKVLPDKYDELWENFFSNRLRLWNQKNEDEANSYITWASIRAAAIAVIPIPLADVAPLVANELYMIYRLAGIYGIANDQTLMPMILGATGGSIVGKIGASFLPFLKIPIAAVVTYGVGKAAKSFFETGRADSLRQG